MYRYDITVREQFIKRYKLHMWILALNFVCNIGVTCNNFCTKSIVEDIMQVAGGPTKPEKP